MNHNDCWHYSFLHQSCFCPIYFETNYRMPVYFGGELFLQKCSKFFLLQKIFTNDPCEQSVSLWYIHKFNFCSKAKKHKILKNNYFSAKVDWYTALLSCFIRC